MTGRKDLTFGSLSLRRTVKGGMRCTDANWDPIPLAMPTIDFAICVLTLDSSSARRAFDIGDIILGYREVPPAWRRPGMLKATWLQCTHEEDEASTCDENIVDAFKMFRGQSDSKSCRRATARG
jgi:hypothetical protein